MHFEIEQLPRQRGHIAEAIESATARLSTLDYALGQLSRRTLGQPAQRALDSYLVAFNRLLLIAPTSMLEPMVAVA